MKREKETKLRETDEIETEYDLLKTTRTQALAIISFLVGYHDIDEDEIDFSK